MGIHGIYKEIGPGRRVALSKLSVEHYIKHDRPLRLAIDISIWLFQIQSGKGGSNPALRTFYYRLLRLLSLNILPLFVFDGPNKPPFKRNKRVGGPNVKVSSIPEFLAKQLLKQFGFPMHAAPGEAEAECALLQRENIVDAVLSEDVDTLMFGSGTTLRSWTPEAKSSKTPTHVNVYDAKATKDGSGLDREGMILIALMSGGDYIPEGIPGCGPKTACEAARAGFGADLCKIKQNDTVALDEWRGRLRHELSTNESKLFRQKRTALVIPDDFPKREVLGYYTHPCVSGADKLQRLRDTLKWDAPLDFLSLRDFTADAFDWRCLGGAKKFIRNLAPALLVRELRLRAERRDSDKNALEEEEKIESRLINAIHSKREHPSTDRMLEYRISFTPINLVNIDLSIEEPDEDVETRDDSDIEAPVGQDAEGGDQECPASPRKRGPSTYDPTVMDKLWITDAFLRLGAPLKVQDWEGSLRVGRTATTTKGTAKDTAKTAKARKEAVEASQRGALDRFTVASKPGVVREAQKQKPTIEEVDLSVTSPPKPVFRRPIEPLAQPRAPPPVLEIDLSKSAPIAYNPPRAQKRRSPDPSSFVSKTDTSTAIIDLLSSSPIPEPHPAIQNTPFRIRRASGDQETDIIDLEQGSYILPLPEPVTKRRKQSPFKRYHTAPTDGEDVSTDTPSVPCLPRPSTPPPVGAVEAMDLASPMPSFPHDMTNDVDIHSPPRTIPKWIRRSQSMTPQKARHGLSDAQHLFTNTPLADQPEILDLSEVDVYTYPQDAYAAPKGLSSFLPSAQRLRNRDGPLGSIPSSPSKSRPKNPALSLTQAKSKTAATTITKAPKASKPKSPRAKRTIKLRQSLEGSWKETESSPIAMASGPERRFRGWRKSEIEVLDLTGN